MTRLVLVLAVLLTLSACGNGRWMGFNNCSADGSPVWFEYPDSSGSYEGLNNGPCKSVAQR